jgi:hypothetical protein
MPFPRIWLSNYSAICSDAHAFSGAEFDRDAVMRLFGLKRRAALLLMEEIGPQKMRGRWVLPKAALLGWLTMQAEAANREIERKARWSRSILQADLVRPRRRLPLLTARLSPEEILAVEQFPAGVTFIPGPPHQLLIEFWDVDDLNQKSLASCVVVNKAPERFAAFGDSQAEQNERDAEAADAAYFHDWLAAHPTSAGKNGPYT